MILRSLLDALKACCAMLLDKRTGVNCQYTMSDIGTAAFSMFFMQSPSFLSHQRALEGAHGRSNCQTLLGMDKIQTDNHIRAMLDPVTPEALFPLFAKTLLVLDGRDKQDCENAAIKRWLCAHGSQYACLKPVYPSDDLMSRQSIFESVQEVKGNFIFTAKPSSHKTLCEWIDGVELLIPEEKIKKGDTFVTHRYRWIEAILLGDGKDAMHVNWFQIEIINKAGKVTDLPVGRDSVVKLAACGRALWKIENEAYNTLKTRGYNQEHNSGHAKQHLPAMLATINLLAFAFHTVCDLVEKLWREAREVTATRKRLFEKMRSINRYRVFPAGGVFVHTMVTGVPPPNLHAS